MSDRLDALLADLPAARRAASPGTAPHERAFALWALLQHDPDAHLDLAALAADEDLPDPAQWDTPLQAVALTALFPRDPARWLARFEAVALAAPGSWVFEALEGVALERVRPLLESLSRAPAPHVARPSLQRLLARPWPGRPDVVLRCLRDPDRAVQALALEAAESFGDDELAHVATMLGDPSADARLVAVEAMEAMTRVAEGARWVLQLHLPDERSARVRRAILEVPGVVAHAAAASEHDASPEGAAAALTARAEATVAALARSAAPWFVERPPLAFVDGAPAPAAVGEYLLFCQHARTGHELDPRALEAAALLSASSRAAWAAALFTAWAERKADVKHHALVTLAAALGGDRVVTLLHREIERWHRAGRRALATHAAELVSCLGGDRAARCLDELARDHPFDALGAFASAALEAEARARGISRDELSDAAVPRWGAGADGRLWLDYGRRRFRATLEAHPAEVLTASLTDTHRRVLTALPRPTRADDPALAAEAQSLWRELRHELPSVVAAERARLEAAMASGRAWSSGAWREGVLGHPVLRALAERLVWRATSPSGRHTLTLRPAGEGLAGEHGEPVRLREGWRVSIAHPVSLDAGERARWRRALGDVEQPFAQLARAVYRAGARELEAMSWGLVEGRALAAPDDRTRRRLPAWTRAGWSSTALEGGVCRSFVRRWGAWEAALAVDGIALWAEHARETAARAITFRRAGEEETVALGEVPEAVRSEAGRAAVHAVTGAADAEAAAEVFSGAKGPRGGARGRGGGSRTR